MDEEEEERAMDLSSRYNKLLQRLTDDATKAETLSSCWTKLDQDTKELTDALRYDNYSKNIFNQTLSNNRTFQGRKSGQQILYGRARRLAGKN